MYIQEHSTTTQPVLCPAPRPPHGVLRAPHKYGFRGLLRVQCPCPTPRPASDALVARGGRGAGGPLSVWPTEPPCSRRGHRGSGRWLMPHRAVMLPGLPGCQQLGTGAWCPLPCDHKSLTSPCWCHGAPHRSFVPTTSHASARARPSGDTDVPLVTPRVPLPSVPGAPLQL